MLLYITENLICQGLYITTSLAYYGVVDYNSSFVVVFTFEIVSFAKNNIFIFVFIQPVYSHKF